MTKLQRLLSLFVYANNWRWFRRWVGGRWENWYCDATMSPLWFHVVEPWAEQWDGRRRPGACFGTPVVEEWPTLPRAVLRE